MPKPPEIETLGSLNFWPGEMDSLPFARHVRVFREDGDFHRCTFHRTDGPAIEYPRIKLWYVNNIWCCIFDRSWNLDGVITIADYEADGDTNWYSRWLSWRREQIEDYWGYEDEDES